MIMPAFRVETPSFRQREDNAGVSSCEATLEPRPLLVDAEQENRWHTRPHYHIDTKSRISASRYRKSEAGESPSETKATATSDDNDRIDCTPNQVWHIDYDARMPAPSDSSVIAIRRETYVPGIMRALQDMGQFGDEMQHAALAAYDLIDRIRLFGRRCSRDPLTEITSALHDAIAGNDRWATYRSEQYLEAAKAFRKYARRPRLDRKLIERAINDLEEIGFDTLPCSIDT